MDLTPSRARPETALPSGLRYGVVHLPGFCLERCGFDVTELAGLLAEEKNALRVVALTPAASAAGLRKGMTATEARARCPEVVLALRDAEGEALDRVALAGHFQRLSDRVMFLGEQDLVLEVGATAHLFGAEAGVVEAARALATAFGHACVIAVADDPIAARALALSGRAGCVPAGQGATALAQLSVDMLCASRSLCRAWQALGITEIGEWAALDPASVAGRYGEEGLRLHRVARGEVATALPDLWVTDTTPIVARVVLGGPTVTLAPLHFVLPGLLHEVSTALERRSQAVVRLVVRLLLERRRHDENPEITRARRIVVTVGRPTRSVSTLERLVRARLERVKLDSPVVELIVEVETATADLAWQPGLVDRTEGEEALPDLLARLEDALGAEALFSPVLVSTWCPEKAWRPAPYAPAALLTGAPRARRIDPVDAVVCFEAELPVPRPSRLLAPPEPIHVRESVRESVRRPVAIHGRVGWQEVHDWRGPEALSSGWWAPEHHFDRVYWVVRLQGAVSWIYYDNPRERWFRHGWFD